MIFRMGKYCEFGVEKLSFEYFINFRRVKKLESIVSEIYKDNRIFS